MTTTTYKQPSLATSVAPEDLKCGDYVTALSTVYEFPSFLWDDSALGNRHDVVRVRFSCYGDRTPMKVLQICLPFVYVQSFSKDRTTIDVRQLQLVRLDQQYAKSVWSVEKSSSKSKKKKRKKKRRRK